MKKLFAFLIALTLAVTCASSVFAEDDVQMGEFIRDGIVDPVDFYWLLKYLAGYEMFYSPEYISQENADMNKDGELNLKDAACFIREFYPDGRMPNVKVELE